MEPESRETGGDPQLHSEAEDVASAETLPAFGPQATAVPRILGGRYLLVEELGAGAMGVVYKGLDQRLDRPIAVKMLKSAANEQLIARMQREAQAVAQLAHPNVVEVFDVGVHDEHPYIVMEFVEGETLEEWAKRSPSPSWRTVVRTYVQAAQGLAAAHAVGIVHRDFKPGNALVTAGGTVKVLDFGLARVDPATGSSQPSGIPMSDATLTATGSTLGTPAYMPPEQHRGETPTPASDIFAFGASLWEALYGRLPFRAKTLEHMSVVKLHGPPSEQPVPSIPPQLHAVLVKSLAPDPDDRFASMDEMVAPLRELVAERRGSGAALLVGVTVTAATIGLAWALWGATPADRCLVAAQTTTKTWASHADAFEASLRTAEIPDRGRTDLVSSYADYGTRWSSAYAATCEGELENGDLQERTQQCLDELRMSWETALRLASEQSDTALELAKRGGSLTSLATCSHGQLSTVQPLPRDPDARAEVLDLRQWGTQYGETRNLGGPPLPAQVDTRLARARALGHLPTVAMYLQIAANDAREQGSDSAVAVYEEAIQIASEGRDDRRAARAAFSLAHVLALSQRNAEATRWAEHARALVRRVHDDADSEFEFEFAWIGSYTATLLELRRPDETLELIEPWLARDDLRPTQRQLFESRRGAALFDLGRLDEAARAHERALQESEAILPPNDPHLLDTLSNLAIAYQYSDRLDDALEAFDRLLRIARDHLPRTDDDRLAYESNAGFAMAQSPARRDEGIALLTEAAQILHAQGPPIQELYTVGGLADALRRAGRVDEAHAMYSRANVLALELLGPDHPLTKQTFDGLEQTRRKGPEGASGP